MQVSILNWPIRTRFTDKNHLLVFKYSKNRLYFSNYVGYSFMKISFSKLWIRPSITNKESPTRMTYPRLQIYSIWTSQKTHKHPWDINIASNFAHRVKAISRRRTFSHEIRLIYIHVEGKTKEQLKSLWIVSTVLF